MPRTPLTIAPRYTKPAMFNGTDSAWRVLCDMYPNAESDAAIMALIEYCAHRRLDPFKRPVHIVSMKNKKLGRYVQTVMQGINEIEITAARTGKWAGMDLPQWGPEVERTFRGTAENDDGSVRTIETTLKFPAWCAVTVWRQIGNERRPFTEQRFWEECYATAGFRSEIPNERWTKAPRQMLHKCTKAEVLRAAFPEEGFGYAAEEMEDREIESGGITLEGKVDHGDPSLTERDRQVEAYERARPPSDEPAQGLARLNDENSTRWLANLQRLLADATSEDELHAITSHVSVARALREAPVLIRQNIQDDLREAHERLTGGSREEEEDPPPPDPVGELLAEVAAMDLIAISALPTNAAWRVKLRDLVPPEADQIEEAIAARKAALQRQQGGR